MNTFDPVAFEEQIYQLPVEQLMAQSARTLDLLQQNPRSFELHFSLALMLCRTEEYKSAVNHLKKAHKFKPRSEIILKTLCEVLLFDTKKYGDALKYLKKWAFLRKDHALIWAYIGECHVKLGKTDAAFEALSAAEKKDPGEQRTYLVRGDAYAKLGDEPAAMESFLKAREIEDNEKAIMKLAALPGFLQDLDAIQSVINVAEKTEDEDSAVFLHSTAAAGYEKLGEYERAFAHFEIANKTRFEEVGTEGVTIAFRNARETFTTEFINSKKHLGHSTKQPIFIVGMPRSGTTLTESILAGHPEITDNGELPYIHSILKHHGLYTQVNPLLAEQLPTLKNVLYNLPDEEFQLFADGYLRDSGFDQKSNKMQVDKLPHNFMSVGLISIIFPNAKIIHCRRHPLDCALSCFKASFSEFHSYATDLKTLGLYYRQYWELMKHWRDVLPGKMFEVCYEDTVANTELVARNMIEHLGLEWDDRCLDHTGSKKTVSTASQWQVRQPIYTTSVAKWKHYEKQLQPMIKAMGSCIQEYEAELAAMAENSQ